MIRKSDKVVISHRNNIEGIVVGFYCNLGEPRAVVRTATGNEWVVKATNLKVVRGCDERG